MDLANKITQECLNLYSKLPKKGKPIPNREWTLLSGIVMEIEGRMSVVALATGTKCMNTNTMSPRGDIVNDSHAEVLARRCFLRFLYDQILKFQQNGNSEVITGQGQGGYEVNPEVKFHFYSSHVPCGDASIIPKLEDRGEKRKYEDDSADTIKRVRSKNTNVIFTMAGEAIRTSENGQIPQNPPGSASVTEDSNLQSINVNTLPRVEDNIDCNSPSYNDMGGRKLNVSVKRCNNSGYQDATHETVEEDPRDSVGEVLDIHRTGAKCVSGEDSRLPGSQYHTVGVVRTKPGRGDPTLSVSCSDKLAKWIACGLQGALLSLLLSQPVLLSTVVIGAGGPYSHSVLHRAIISRSGTSYCPILLHSELVFPHSRYQSDPTSKPCPTAIMWSQVPQKPLEVCVEGKRLGATKKCKDNGRLMVCKLELMRTFMSVKGGDRFKGMRYRDIKLSATSYNNTWAEVRSAMGGWITKPDHLEHFSL